MCPSKLGWNSLNTRVAGGTDFETVGTLVDDTLTRNTGYIGGVGNGPAIKTSRRLDGTPERIGMDTSTT
jgi:hypothetical protein